MFQRWRAVGLAVLITLGTMAAGYAQTVKIRFGQVIRSSNGHEWAVDVYADVFDQNRVLVPHEQAAQYLYEWYWMTCTGGGGYELYQSGVGLNHLYPDGHWMKEPGDPDCCSSCHFMNFYMYVRVWIGNTWITSAEVRVPDNELGTLTPREAIVVNQKRETQVNVGVVGRRIQDNLSNQLYFYPAPFTFYNLAGQPEVFKATQELLSNPYEKYHRWVAGLAPISDVVNHHSFTIQSQQPQLTAALSTVQGASVRAQLLDGGSAGGTASFLIKDPWLVDDFSDPLGPRNRGMNALWQPLTDSTNNLGINTNFKGVFLNQRYDVPNPVYYSVGAPQPNTFRINNQDYQAYFQKWDDSQPAQVEFQNASAAQTGVVFKQAGATATAKYKAYLASSLASATATNSQRKLSADFGTVETKIALCYASGGEIWLSESNGWEVPFAAEERVSDGTGGFGFPSLVAFGRADELDYPLGFAYIAPRT